MGVGLGVRDVYNERRNSNPKRKKKSRQVRRVIIRRPSDHKRITLSKASILFRRGKKRV